MMRKAIHYIEDAFDQHTTPKQVYLSLFMLIAALIAFLFLLREVVFIVLEVIT